MRPKLLFFLFLLLTFILPLHASSPVEFPHNNWLFQYHEGQFLRLSNGNIHFYFNTGTINTTDTLKLTTSSDDGNSWSAPKTVFTFSGNTSDTIHFSPEIMPDGRICIVLAKQPYSTYGKLYRSFSSDMGVTWTQPVIFGGGLGYTGKRPRLKTIGSQVILFYSTSETTLKYRISPDSGKTYGSDLELPVNTTSFRRITSVLNTTSGIKVITSERKTGKLAIYLYSSTDNASTWSSPQLILEDTTDLYTPSAVTSDGINIYLAYDKTILSKLRRLPQREVYYISSANGGISWSPQNRFTFFSRTDNNPVLFGSFSGPRIMFASSRYSNSAALTRLWQARLLVDSDTLAPPAYITSAHTTPQVNQPVNFRVTVDDESGVSEVTAPVTTNFSSYSVQLYDDGLHDDELAGDNIWGGNLGSFSYNTQVNYFVRIVNTKSVVLQIYAGGFTMAPFNPSVHVFDENKIIFPIDQAGNLADAGENAGGKLDGQSLFFSGGFFLSGYKQDTLWATAQFSTSRLNDYLPGSVGSDPNSLDFGLYVVNAGDTAFSHSWQRWQRAVDFGASFYDGNNDGIYTPVDLNSNGVWDPNEDKPDILGNETAWCIYNDGQSPPLRRYSNMIPRGIEISQTVFAFRNSEYSLNNAIFVRYRIVNKSDFDYDSVYFSVVSDPDIGVNYSEDYTASDTLLSSSFAYKKSGDNGGYGSNPPAAFNTLLQGPVVYIPGLTFTDINLNGEYDEGIDIPLMNAFNYRGPQLGTDTIKGAKNLGMNAFTFYMGSHPTFGDPNTASEMRYYQLGGVDKNGVPVNVCTFAFGNGNSLSNCSTINPKYFFSGDPVSQSGWLNTTSSDMRLNLSAGPFRLKRNVPQYIVAAYTGIRGSSPLNSITLTRQAVSEITQGFKNNFPVVVGVKEKDTRQFLNSLNQNYPNPVSDKTVIRFIVANSGRVSIKVYDLLGNTVKILTDESKLPGSYDLVLDTRSLAAGIYFYEMRTAEQNIVKKFVVVR